MPVVKWQGRDSEGRLIDITADTDQPLVLVPGPNAIEESAAASGGVTVVGETTGEVTTLISPGATIAGDEATLAGGFVSSATDPGAIGAGSVWKDTSLGVSAQTVWRERNISNTAWEAFAGPRTVSTGADNSNAGPTAVAQGSGNANARLLAQSEDGNANASATAQSAGGETDASSNATVSFGAGDAYASSYAQTADGAADASLTATSSAGDATVEASATATTGEATAGSYAVRGAVTAGMSCVVDGTSGRMAFNGTTPIAKPTGVAVTAEAIHAALVSLGLIAA